MSGLLLAAKAALEFIQSIDGYENSVTAVNLRREIEAVEQSVQADGARCFWGGEYYQDKVFGWVCCRCQAPRR